MSTSSDPFDDLASLDPSRVAAKGLSEAMGDQEVSDDIVILDEKLREREEKRAAAEVVVQEESVTAGPAVVSASDVRTGAPILEQYSERDTVRLLILTRNTGIRELGGLSQKRILELGQIFAEIHVIILNVHEEETTATVRLSDNIWLYSTESTSWWRTPFDARKIAREQISFAGGFRADVVIAEDPFESGVAGYYIGKEFDRPFQVHVLEDIYEPSFEDRDEHNNLRLFASRFVFKRAGCIRTAGDFVRSAIVDEYPDLAGKIEVLPTYHNLRVWRDTPAAFDLKERYPQFKFIILHISAMHTQSHTAEVIASVASILHRYPTIGLVIVGNGPLRAALEKQAISLGVHDQVEFEPMTDDTVSHMKTANILVHLSEDSEEDDIVLQAAAVKLPMVASIESVANTLFIDGESAYLCNATDTATVARRVNTFLNENQARARLALNAQEAVFERVEQDYGAFLRSYRASIERCIG